MDSDTPLVVKLEVTVPHIVLSALQNRPAQTEPGAGEHNVKSWQSTEIEEMAQVRLLLSEQLQDISHQHQLRELQQGITGEASSRMIQTMRFRVFRVEIPVIQGQAFLLQIIRWCGKITGTEKRERNTASGGNRHQYVTDELAFSLECRHTGEASTETALAVSASTALSALIPGLNRVAIFLDNEGTPCSYSIDGAES